MSYQHTFSHPGLWTMLALALPTVVAAALVLSLPLRGTARKPAGVPGDVRSRSVAIEVR